MKAIRTIFAAAAISPFLCLAACDLAKLREPDADASVVTAASIAPPATATATDTTAAVATIAAVATVAPVGAKPTGKTATLPNGQKGAVVTLTDGGTAVVPQSADGGIPGIAGFVMPTALPSSLVIPSSIPRTLPTTLPSGFPTTLPSGFTLPTLPTATATH